MINTIEIEPSQLLGLFEEDQSLFDTLAGERVVMCEGVKVAKIKPSEDSEMWDLTAVACTSPAHGVHPKYAKYAEKLKAQTSNVREHTSLIPDNKKCDQCNGEGWLKPDTAGAQLSVLLMRVIRMFRGIVIGPPEPKEGGLSSVAAAATINQFLSGAGLSQRVASHDPTPFPPKVVGSTYSEALEKTKVKKGEDHDQ